MTSCHRSTNIRGEPRDPPSCLSPSDHSEMIVCATMQIRFWMRPIQRLYDNPTRQVHLHCPQDGRIRMTWVLKLNFDHVCQVDQCLYLWMYIPAVLCTFFLNLYFFHNKGKLSAAGMFRSPKSERHFKQSGRSNNTEIVEYPHSAIGHRLSATKVYENNVPSLDWHGLKNFKDFHEFVNVSFFLLFFLSKKLNSANSTGRIYIYKQIHFSNKKTIYTFRFCVFEVLFVRLNTMLTVLWIILCKYSFLFFVSFFLYVASCMQYKICRIFVNLLEMWKQMSILCRVGV